MSLLTAKDKSISWLDPSLYEMTVDIERGIEEV